MKQVWDEVQNGIQAEIPLGILKKPTKQTKKKTPQPWFKGWKNPAQPLRVILHIYDHLTSFIVMLNSLPVELPGQGRWAGL